MAARFNKWGNGSGSSSGKRLQRNLTETRYEIQEDGTVRVFHKTPVRQISVSDIKLIDYKGHEDQFRIPEQVILSETARIIIDNIWIGHKTKNTANVVLALKALSFHLEGEQKYYALFTGKNRGAYTKWKEVVKAMGQGGTHKFKKYDTLEETIDALSEVGGIEGLNFSQDIQKQAELYISSFKGNTEVQQTLARQCGLTEKIKFLEQQNEKLKEENLKLTEENEKLKNNLDQIYAEALSEADAIQKKTVQGEILEITKNLYQIALATKQSLDEHRDNFAEHDSKASDSWKEDLSLYQKEILRQLIKEEIIEAREDTEISTQPKEED